MTEKLSKELVAPGVAETFMILKAFRKSEFANNLHFKQPNELSVQDIEFLIEKLMESEKESRFNKGRRFAKQNRLTLEKELKKRELKTLVNSK